MISENNISTEIELKVDNIYKSIDDKIANREFQLAYEIATKNKAYLSQYSNVKQQLLLNKYFTIILYEITLSAYSIEKDYNKFVESFEQNRNFFEVHLEKPKYNKLLRYDANIKKAIRKKKMKFILPTLGLVVIIAVFAVFNLDLMPNKSKSQSDDTSTVQEEPLSTPEENGDNSSTLNSDSETLVVDVPVDIGTDGSDSSIEQGYMLPSDNKVLTLDDINGMNAKDLRLAINEMYARHGYYFGPGSNQRYFDSMPWYKPDMNVTSPNDIIENFTNIENNNLAFLANQEKLSKNN